MIYLLSWNIESKNYTISGDYESIWRVYYSLIQTLKMVQTERDIYIWCTDNVGRYINIRTRCPIVAEKGYERILISKGSQTYQRKPL